MTEYMEEDCDQKKNGCTDLCRERKFKRVDKLWNHCMNSIAKFYLRSFIKESTYMEEKKCQIKSQDFRKSRGTQDRTANMIDNRENKRI